MGLSGLLWHISHQIIHSSQYNTYMFVIITLIITPSTQQNMCIFIKQSQYSDVNLGIQEVYEHVVSSGVPMYDWPSFIVTDFERARVQLAARCDDDDDEGGGRRVRVGDVTVDPNDPHCLGSDVSVNVTPVKASRDSVMVTPQTAPPARSASGSVSDRIGMPLRRKKKMKKSWSKTLMS